MLGKLFIMAMLCNAESKLKSLARSYTVLSILFRSQLGIMKTYTRYQEWTGILQPPADFVALVEVEIM